MNHEEQWARLRDFYLKKFEETKDSKYDYRYHACKRMLGEEELKPDEKDFIHFT